MHQYLESMGIQTWQLRGKINLTEDNLLPPAIQIPDNENNLAKKLFSLSKTVAACTACSLSQDRTQTVFGTGNAQAKLMLIGEAPGFYEDQQGEPFVGKAGQLLTAMLKAISLTREEVYIANILKCRPPENRDPQPEEIKCCTPYLKSQIEIIQPKLILALGRIAAQYLLNTQASMTNIRGKIYHWGEKKIPLIATFHPAYLLRNPQDKKLAYKDLLLTQQQLKELS